MRQRHHVLAIAALVLLGAAHSPLGAQQRQLIKSTGPAAVTLHVPLQLQNIDPRATEAVVWCTARFMGGNSQLPVQSIAADSVPISGGSYNGSVDVKFSLASRPGDQWRYDCKLELSSATLKQTYYAGAAPWTTPKAGTSSSIEVSGTITTQ
jgi:hypothetical protein